MPDLSPYQQEAPQVVRTESPLTHACSAGITEIAPHWLVEAAAPLCSVSAPLDEPPPQYVAKADAVLAWHDVSFGRHQWELPRTRRRHPDAAIRARAFAAALLDGGVLPSMSGASRLPHDWRLRQSEQQGFLQKNRSRLSEGFVARDRSEAFISRGLDFCLFFSQRVDVKSPTYCTCKQATLHDFISGCTRVSRQ